MITFAVAAANKKTHQCLRNQIGAPPVTVLSYEQLFRRRTLPIATYIFTDFDLLSSKDLKFAAAVYNQMQTSGWQPLNNPARVRQRYALLRLLHRVGINHHHDCLLEPGAMSATLTSDDVAWGCQ